MCFFLKSVVAGGNDEKCISSRFDHDKCHRWGADAGESEHKSIGSPGQGPWIGAVFMGTLALHRLVGMHKRADKAPIHGASFLWRKGCNGCARSTLIDVI